MEPVNEPRWSMDRVLHVDGTAADQWRQRRRARSSAGEADNLPAATTDRESLWAVAHEGWAPSRRPAAGFTKVRPSEKFCGPALRPRSRPAHPPTRRPSRPSFRGGDGTRIHHQLGGAPIVRPPQFVDRLDVQSPIAQGEGAGLDLRTSLAIEQSADLRPDERRRDQPMSAYVQATEHQLDVRGLVAIVGQDSSHQRPRAPVDHSGRPHPAPHLVSRTSDRGATSAGSSGPAI